MALSVIPLSLIFLLVFKLALLPRPPRDDSAPAPFKSAKTVKTLIRGGSRSFGADGERRRWRDALPSDDCCMTDTIRPRDLNVDLRWSQQKQEAVIDPGDDSLSTSVSFVSKPARKEWATGANDKGKVLAVIWFKPIEALAKGCEALSKGGKSAQAT
ncbi:hypothetical protein [Caballeronia sordidicola]|uniref:hypothetical protein n=1 Tax=Caballeronia sordidicola TaxID=196367 RepID=UPI001C4F8C80|nr:hypothetical protein [Caballeronia sordidicola]